MSRLFERTDKQGIVSEYTQLSNGNASTLVVSDAETLVSLDSDPNDDNKVKPPLSANSAKA